MLSEATLDDLHTLFPLILPALLPHMIAQLISVLGDVQCVYFCEAKVEKLPFKPLFVWWQTP